jgi:hypothetical protein
MANLRQLAQKAGKTDFDKPRCREASRSAGPSGPLASRAPGDFGVREARPSDGLPGAAKNTGDDACLLPYPSPARGGWLVAKRRVGWGYANIAPTRRSLPLAAALPRKRGRDKKEKNTGDDACLLVIPGRPPKPEGRRRDEPGIQTQNKAPASGFRALGLTASPRNDETHMSRETSAPLVLRHGSCANSEGTGRLRNWQTSKS